MSSGNAYRRKGRTFAAQVAAIFRDAGWHVQPIGSGVGGCDHLIMADGVMLYNEAKNQERLKVPEWWDQTCASTPPRGVPVLTFKLRGQTLSLLPAEQLARLAHRSAS